MIRMEIQKGSVVYSKAGRDKARMLLVLETTGEYAYVADGILRTVAKPKKKKMKHLQKTNRIFGVTSEITDSDIRKVLTCFKEDN